MNRMFLVGCGLLCLVLGVFLGPGQADAVKTVRIGILQDGPYWHNQPLISHVKSELAKLNDGQLDIQYPKAFTLNGQYNFERIQKYAVDLTNNKEVDAIIAFGMASSYYFAKMDPLPVPVVAMDYILPAGLGMLAPKTFKPLNPNWTTSFDPAYVNSLLKIFPKLVAADRFAVLCPQAVCGFHPDIPRLIKSFVGQNAPKVDIIVISPQDYMKKINQLNVHLVVVEMLKGFTEVQMEDVYRTLAHKRIPAFTVDGLHGIQKGALVSIHDYDKARVGRNIALKLFDILNGTRPDKIPVIDFKNAELIFNRETARKIGYSIPFEFVDEARMYGAEPKKTRLTFEKAIQRSLGQNFDIKAQALVRNQALLQVDITQRGFYPQVSSRLNYNRTNKDQADVFGGPRGETRLELSLQQKLYDRELSKSIESAEASHQIEKRNLEVVNQDVLEQVALAYMDNLLGEELVKIQRNYLNVIRKNQNLAELKFKLRETGKSDVLRLNIELDNARIDLINAKEARFRAQVRLNNLLNLPRETVHGFDRNKFSEESYRSRAGRFSIFLNTASKLKIFRDFFDEQAREHSPDLKALHAGLDQALADKQRTLAKFYPTAELEAQYFNQLQDDTQDLSPANRQLFEDRFGDGWQAKLKLEFPLFLGGSRYKQVTQANVRILELQAQINSLKNSLSEQARSGLFNVFRVRRNFDFSLRNVASSQENLKLAEVSYVEGDLPVIDLLDSQSRLILSKTNAAQARFEFYKTLFSLFRDVGRIDLLTEFNSVEKMRGFLAEVERHFHQQAVGK
jgi:outer membrane protein TolC